MPPVNPATQLPTPTRARRAEPRAAPPYKWYLLGGALFALMCIAGLIVSLVVVLKVAKQEGYDPELSKKYPALALYIFGKKTTKTGDEFVIDSEHGIVTYREIPSGRRVRLQEDAGTIKRLPLEEEQHADPVAAPSQITEPEPKKRIKVTPRKSQKDNF